MLGVNPLAGQVFAQLTGSIDGVAAISNYSFPASEGVPKKGVIMLPQYGQIIVKNLLNRRYGQITTIAVANKPAYGQIITRQITES